MNLLDVNVLIALAWPNHLHHAVALSWFEANVESGWATCAVTELTAAIAGHRQVTDGYLLHLAKTNEGYLITLDRGIEKLAASIDAYRHVVRCVLPPR